MISVLNITNVNECFQVPGSSKCISQAISCNLQSAELISQKISNSNIRQLISRYRVLYDYFPYFFPSDISLLVDGSTVGVFVAKTLHYFQLAYQMIDHLKTDYTVCLIVRNRLLENKEYEVAILLSILSHSQEMVVCVTISRVSKRFKCCNVKQRCFACPLKFPLCPAWLYVNICGLCQ